MYVVHIEGSAEKSLERIDRGQVQRILKKLNDVLSRSPFSNGVNPKQLQGDKYFRLRIGDYRAVYYIDGDMVVITHITHRKDAYR